MTSQTNSPVEMNLKSELDQLAYFAFLLILDPTLALSVVKAALDEWPEQVTGPDLLERTVVLSLQELQHYPCMGRRTRCVAISTVKFNAPECRGDIWQRADVSITCAVLNGLLSQPHLHSCHEEFVRVWT